MLLLSAASPKDVRQIERICDRFEAAWKAGKQPRLELYLGQAPEPLRTILLRHLLPLDWEYRLQAGDQPQAAECDMRFPAAGTLIEAISREVADTTAFEAVRPQRLGAYRVVREVGRGGMGVVYEAVQEPLGR